MVRNQRWQAKREMERYRTQDDRIIPIGRTPVFQCSYQLEKGQLECINAEKKLFISMLIRAVLKNWWERVWQWIDAQFTTLYQLGTTKCRRCIKVNRSRLVSHRCYDGSTACYSWSGWVNARASCDQSKGEVEKQLDFLWQSHWNKHL